MSRQLNHIDPRSYPVIGAHEVVYRTPREIRRRKRKVALRRFWQRLTRQAREC